MSEVTERGGRAAADGADVDLVGRLRAAGCVYAEEEAALLVGAAGSAAELEAMVARRVQGHPLEQVVGWAELAEVRVAVEPDVFVPRRRTTLMVREAVAGCARAHGVPVILDLCCGSGAVGLAVVSGLGRTAELHATDLHPAAVRCARRNLAGLGTVYCGDLDEPLPASLRGRVDVLVANVPYVPTDEIALLPAEARLHEPGLTLDGGADGLRVLARVAVLAPRWLTPGGSVLLETSERQLSAAVATVATAGLAARGVTDEELGASVVVGTLDSR